MTALRIGKVFLVGAGPGDPELITLKGQRCLAAAEAIFYDELANRELLEFASNAAQLIYVGKRPGKHCTNQRAIEALLIDHARQGQMVVRLKGGDPFVFGRGGEEALALRQAGIPFEIVPGISSAIAAPAYAGIPVTHRGKAASFAVVTGHGMVGDATDWAGLSRSVDTLVILMGLGNLAAIMEQLLAGGCSAQRAVALIESGTRSGQIVVTGTVGDIAGRARRYRLSSPVTIVIGSVVGLADQLDWFGGRPSSTCDGFGLAAASTGSIAAA